MLIYSDEIENKYINLYIATFCESDQVVSFPFKLNLFEYKEKVY